MSINEAKEREAFEKWALTEEFFKPDLVRAEHEEEYQNIYMRALFRGWLARSQAPTNAVNALCAVMVRNGLATGHGDHLDSVLAELELEIISLRKHAPPAWVATAANLPEADFDVGDGGKIAYVLGAGADGAISGAFYDPESGRWGITGGSEIDKPDFWMPLDYLRSLLPSPPQAEEKKA